MSQPPISPHLQVYRLPWTATLSILHRFSGVVLSLGMVVGVLALLAFSSNKGNLAAFQQTMNSPVGVLLLWGWIFSLFLHLSHGIRHLIWDTGRGFSRESLDLHAALEILGAVSLTVVCLLIQHVQN